MSLNGPTEVQVCADPPGRKDVFSATAKAEVAVDGVARVTRDGIAKAGGGQGMEIADVCLRPAGDSVTSCSRGSPARESRAPASRGPSIHLAQARKSRFADSRARNMAR